MPVLRNQHRWGPMGRGKGLLDSNYYTSNDGCKLRINECGDKKKEVIRIMRRQDMTWEEIDDQDEDDYDVQLILKHKKKLLHEVNKGIDTSTKQSTAPKRIIKGKIDTDGFCTVERKKQKYVRGKMNVGKSLSHKSSAFKTWAKISSKMSGSDSSDHIENQTQFMSAEEEDEIEKALNVTLKPDEMNEMKDQEMQDDEMSVGDELIEEAIRNEVSIVWEKIKNLAKETQTKLTINEEAQLYEMKEYYEKLLEVKKIREELQYNKKNQSFHDNFVAEEEQQEQAHCDKILHEHKGNDTKRKINSLVQLFVRLSEEIGNEVNDDQIRRMQLLDESDIRKKLGVVILEKRKHQKLQNSERNTKEVPVVTPRKKPMSTGKIMREPENVQKIVNNPGKNMERINGNDITTEPPIVEEEIVNNVKPKVRKIYTARFQINVRESSANVGYVLKQIFKQWSILDPSTVLLEYGKEFNNESMIDHENKIPNSEEGVRKYVAAIHQFKDTLNFSIRLSGTESNWVIKKKAATWLEQNKCYVKMDTIRAASIHAVGFFINIHPDYYNRESFKQTLMDEMKHLKMRDDINVYPRKVWTWQNGKKIISRALVLEVPKDFKDVVSREVMKMDKSMYPQIEYVPFTRYEDDEYKQILAKILRANNQYLHETRRITIYGVRNIQEEFELLNGEKATFQEWVEQLRYQNVEFVEACEVGKDDSIKIVYNQKFERTIRKFMGNGIKSIAVRSFKPDDVSKIFCANDRSNSGDGGITMEELKYMDDLKRRFDINPQEPEQGDKRELSYSRAAQGPPKKLLKKNLYYSSFEKPSVMRFNITNNENDNGESRVTAKPDVNADHDTLSSKIEKLTERIFSIEQNSQHSQMNNEEKMKEVDKQIVDDMEKSFDRKLEKLDIKFQKQLDENNERQRKILERSEDRLLERIGQMQLEQADKVQKSTLDHMDERLELMFTKICERMQNQGSTNDGVDANPVVGKN